MLKETNTPTRPRIEPGSPDPESDALTIRPVRPPNEIGELLNELREIANKKSNGLNFDNDDAMTDEDYTRLTGITKDQFKIVHESLSSLRSTSPRSARTALAMLLVKLRTGLSLAVLSTLFGVKKSYL